LRSGWQETVNTKETAMTDEKKAADLLEHQLGTYFTLRVVLAGIAFALPVVVAIAGRWQCANPPQWLAGSLSAYYHRTALAEFLTARDFFVGGLIGAAVCLYAYKGYSMKENVALNMAAVFAIGVALLPTAHGGIADPLETAKASCVVFMGEGYRDATIRPALHALSAVLFFFCLAYVSIWRSRDTLRNLKDEQRRAFYNRWYFFSGAAMILSPVIAVLVSTIADAKHPIIIFLVETFGVWAFGIYWAFKSREMRETNLDIKVASADVERAKVPTEPPAKALDRALYTVQVGGADSVERVVPVNRAKK
jgi:hypothetical protein